MNAKKNEGYYMNKKIVIVVPSYKNSKWYEKNLSSIISQNYDNFRVIYVDDCSPDNTGQLVEDFISKHNKEKLIKLIRNKDRKGAMHNLYDIIHSCEDDEVIITLDGDDWFATPNVLKKINSVYSDPNVWMTYGSYQDSPQGSRGCCRPFEPMIVQQNTFRRAQWRASHLRTFYKWIFAKIRKEDFYDPRGKWLDMAWDLSFMLPILEMAGPRHRYVHEILYVYNNENPIQDYKVNIQRQGMLDRYIRTKPPYKRLP